MKPNAALELGAASAAHATPLRVELQCPVCGRALGSVVAGQVVCHDCGLSIVQAEGIYRALPHDRALYFRRFLREYQSVRQKEGRGSDSPEYYLALPFHDLTGNNSWQWSIRARSFLYFEKNLLPKIATQSPMGADILDVGAGNGWLSYGLALSQHHPIAVDLLDNSCDGLAAARHYLARLAEPFPCFHAEMDRLPFASRQFDAVVFNASLHYSIDYAVTLQEALRCLRRPGYLVIVDTPFYRRAASGEQMLAERKANFCRRFGFASDSLPSKEYLTPEVLADLARRLSFAWHVAKPWYGLNWAMRPLKACILRKREPAKFYLLWARVE
jgi:SAM-dependent methyltransferase